MACTWQEFGASSDLVQAHNTSPCRCVGTAADPGKYYGTTNSCIGSEIPFEKALVSAITSRLDNAFCPGSDACVYVSDGCAYNDMVLDCPMMAMQAATFLEGIVFLIICFTGMRSRLIKIFPRTVLMAGACGIGAFIAFVGVKVRQDRLGSSCSLMPPQCAYLAMRRQG